MPNSDKTLDIVSKLVSVYQVASGSSCSHNDCNIFHRKESLVDALPQKSTVFSKDIKCL